MYKLSGIALGIAATILWFMPLGEYRFAAIKHTMSLSGRAISDLSPLTYGVPVSMLLFSTSVYLSQRHLEIAFAVVGAVCTAVIYSKLGGGYTPAFLALATASALCVVLSVANAARNYGSNAVGKPEA